LKDVDVGARVMKLGLVVGYSGARARLDLDYIRHAETLGFESVWTAEAYGSDAVTPATWILANTTKIKVGTAIMQMPARTPACTAMTAMTLDHLSGGRFVLGIGPSGPQVVEGWHGQSYARPLTRLQEYVSILRKIFAREAPLEHEGFHYTIPRTGEGTTGLGKPLKSILHGNPKLPIYVAAMRPKALATAAEIADGVFPLWMSPDKSDLITKHIEPGFAKAGGGKGFSDFDIAPTCAVILGDDVQQCRNMVKGGMGLYIGGMGAKGQNFYTEYATKLGYGDAATKVQDLFLGGKKQEAIAAVPDELVDEVALVGPAERIKERLGPWKKAAARGHLGTLMVGAGQREALELLANELL
jgi:F420-dependent oxidoreductase-like protein